MKTLVLVEHDNSAVKDATLATVSAAAKLGEVHLLVAGKGCAGVAEAAAKIAGVGKVHLADDAAYEHQLAENVAPLVAEEPAEYEPIESLWYKVQLGARQLWELPMNEGTVRLAEGVTLDRERLPLLCAAQRPFTVTHGEHRWPLSESEATLLVLFDSPQVFGEALFERTAVAAGSGSWSGRHPSG